MVITIEFINVFSTILYQFNHKTRFIEKTFIDKTKRMENVFQNPISELTINKLKRAAQWRSG